MPRSGTLLLLYIVLIMDQHVSINLYFFLLSDGLTACFVGDRGQENVIYGYRSYCHSSWLTLSPPHLNNV